MWTYLDALALGIGYLVLAAGAGGAAVFTYSLISGARTERRERRQLAATAEHQARPSSDLDDIDLSDLDGELRRLTEGTGQ